MLDKPDPQHDLDAAVAFLQALRPRGPWNLTAIAPDGPIASATFTDPVKARAWLATHVESANLHFVPNPAATPAGRGGRVRKDDIEMIEYLHGDFDLDKLPEDHPLADESAEGRKGSVAAEMDLDGPPSLIVDSGGGLQGLWRLSEPIPATDENIAWAEGANRWLAGKYPGGEPQCANIDHLLRLPGTINFPNEKKRKRGRVIVSSKLIAADGTQHQRDAFGHVAAPAKVSVDTNIEPEEVTDLDALAAHYDLSPTLVATILHGHEPDNPDRLPSRNEWVFSVVSQLLDRQVPHAMIAGVLLNPEWLISESVYAEDQKAGSRTSRDYAIRQVVRALEKRAAEQEDDRRLLAETPVDFDAIPAYEPERRDPSRPHPFKRFSIDELRDLPDPVWIANGLLLERSLVMLYGPPKSFKTFLALGLALSIATGRDFHNVPVVRGRVTYVAAEGHAAETRDRVLAWCHENKVRPSELSGWFDLVVSGVRLDRPESVKEFLQVDPSPRTVVFFDTLNRNMEGHESDTKDMTGVVSGCDRVRRALQTMVVVVHHTGIEQGRARGSTVLIGAVDTSLRVTRSKDTVTLLVEAQRAGPDGVKWHFETATGFAGNDADGIIRESVVLKPVAAPVSKGHQDQESAQQKQSAEDIMLMRIEQEKPKSYLALHNDSIAGFSKANVYKVRDRLLERKLVRPGDRPALTKAGEERVKTVRDEGE